MTGTRARVLVAAYGSAGDLFPLVPMVRKLRADGHHVRFAVPRSLSLYVRSWGLPLVQFGRSSDMRVLDDPEIATSRFDGWASIRRMSVRHIAPTLAEDTARLSEVMAQWRPDVVVTATFAVAARLAANQRDVPVLDVTVYPQALMRLPGSRSFGLSLRRAVASASPDLADDSSHVTALTWGIGEETVVLHDPALLGAALDAVHGPPLDPVGFPHWDAIPERPGEGEEVEAWLHSPGPPAVLITLGSFPVARQRAIWLEAVEATETLGLRGVLVGPRRHRDDQALLGRSNLLATGYVRLSRIAGMVDTMVHHGGIGTTFCALRAGRPAVVIPQAFDQPFNARLLERTGVAVNGSSCTLEAALEQVVTDAGYAHRAAWLAASLVPSELATERVTNRVLDLAGIHHTQFAPTMTQGRP